LLKKIRKWLSVLFIFASMLVGFWIYAENTYPVEVMLFGFPLQAQPLGLVIIVIFTSGIVLGLFCNVLVTSWMVFKMKRLQKQLQRFEPHNLEKNS
jgi:uncharacterized integral membrane protein